VATSVFALVIAGINPFIYAVAIAGILIPPYSAFQEQKITDCKGKHLCVLPEFEVGHANTLLRLCNDLTFFIIIFV
jgi:hypothetical protein